MSDVLGPLLPHLGLPTPATDNQRLAVALLAWLVIAVLTYLALSAGRVFGRRTRTEYDDVLLERVKAPLLVALLFAAMVDVMSHWEAGSAGRIGGPVVAIGLIAALVWLVQRLALDVVLHIAQRRAATTATSMDDMLVPIAKSIIRPISIGVGAMFALEAIGLPIAGAALLVGGASFVLAFALQSTLEDVFGGVGLVVDTPFALGDVIRLQDGTLCQVVGLGMRVTRLYNAMDHSIITYSNRGLVQQAIVNLSRPTPDMCLAIRILVAKHSDTRLVWERLTEAANAHPWVLADTKLKLPAMRRKMNRLARVHDYRRAFHTIREMQRVAAEGQLNEGVERLSLHVVETASRSHFLKHGGIDSNERQSVESDLDQLHALVREVKGLLSVWLLTVRYTYVDAVVCKMSVESEASLDAAIRGVLNRGSEDPSQVLTSIHHIVEEHFAAGFDRAREYVSTVKGWVEAALDGAEDAPPVCLAGSVPAADLFFLTQRQEDHFRQCGFSAGLADRPNGGIADLDRVEEYLALFAEWNKKMQLLEGRVRDLSGELGRTRGMRLDERLHDLRRWLESDFKESTPEWKYPRTPLVHVGEQLEYELRVHVDNVRLSHFTRTAQVESQLRLDILHLLRDQYPAVDFGKGSAVKPPASS